MKTEEAAKAPEAHSETSRRIRMANAYAAIADRIATDACNYRIRTRRVGSDGMSRAELSWIWESMQRLLDDKPQTPDDWAKQALKLLANEEQAKDLLYLACTAAEEGRLSAVSEWFTGRGLTEEGAAKAAGLMEGSNRDLNLVIRELRGMLTECHVEVHEKFRDIFSMCAKASDRLVIPAAKRPMAAIENERVDIAVFDKACLAAEQATISSRKGGNQEKVPNLIANAVALMDQAGKPVPSHSGSSSVKAVDSHILRTAVKLFFYRGHVPPEGRYCRHISVLASFAARQCELLDDPVEARLANLLRLEYLHAGDLAGNSWSLEGATSRYEAFWAEKAHRSVEELCLALEDRGGCLGILISASADFIDLKETTTQLQQWKQDVEKAAAGVTWKDGVPVVGASPVSRPSTECSQAGLPDFPPLQWRLDEDSQKDACLQWERISPADQHKLIYFFLFEGKHTHSTLTEAVFGLDKGNGKKSWSVWNVGLSPDHKGLYEGYILRDVIAHLSLRDDLEEILRHLEAYSASHPDEFGATGIPVKQGSATVHSGRFRNVSECRQEQPKDQTVNRSFGDLFDD